MNDRDRDALLRKLLDRLDQLDLPGLAEGRHRLGRLAHRFGLSDVEADLLLLCVGAEMDPELAGLAAQWSGGGGGGFVTAATAVSALGGDWAALGPDAPLRRWRLIEVGAAERRTEAPLRVTDAVLRHLTGVDQLDDELVGVLAPLPVDPPDRWHEEPARRVAAIWSGRDRSGAIPAVRLMGDPDESAAVFAAACRLCGLRPHELQAATLPDRPHDLEALVRLCEREALLHDVALLLPAEEAGADPGRRAVVGVFVGGLGTPLAVTGLGVRAGRRLVVTVAVEPPDPLARRTMWADALAAVAGAAPEASAPTDADEAARRLAGHFTLGPTAVRAAADEAVARLPVTPDGTVEELLWEVARERTRVPVEGLAERRPTAAGWSDLVLPEQATATLRGLVRHVRHRTLVHEDWGFDGHRATPGVTALFAGPSGTGKTMAAGVVAGELGLDLYRVDLSGVVSKYIGETEKNLARVFAAAECSGAVLFFDEADALFGRRSEVRDSHDRYANLEISYLLQRMDSYRGLAILASNLPDALDGAFLRRLRFVVRFPFPGREERAAMWSRAFPPRTPTDGLDPERLAVLQVSGGLIRNIALGAAFLAAEAGEPVGIRHVLDAVREEYAKQQRPLLPEEVSGLSRVDKGHS